MNENRSLLSVRNLTVTFPSPRGTVQAVNGISYDIGRGEVLGIVGESGSGKSVEAFSIMGLLSPSASVRAERIEFEGTDLLSLTERELQHLRGSSISMIFQDPMSCIDPVFRVGSFLVEVLRSHDPAVTKAEAQVRSIEMLRRMGIRNPEEVMRQYQSSLSGGMRQRVMIAAALLCGPKLLIADEPTTALDVTIQDQIITLLKELKSGSDMSILFITHNLGLVADICDRVIVMYGGHIMERGTIDDIFYDTAHPYTRGLLAAMPRVDAAEHVPLQSIEGLPVDATALPEGCVFHPRCPLCTELCRKKLPRETTLSRTHSAACWRLYGEE